MRFVKTKSKARTCILSNVRKAIDRNKGKNSKNNETIIYARLIQNNDGKWRIELDIKERKFP